MPTHLPGGPHELGQNNLVSRPAIEMVTRIVANTTGPIVEIAAGDGALTIPLSHTRRPVTAVEIDPRRARVLDRNTPRHVHVVNGDLLRFRFPEHRHVVVGNLPFHLTTAAMQRILAANHWQTAVLLVQWEVARKRAAVGGATALTACWWPWFEFTLHARIPARAFRPMPTVDGGLLSITRRTQPLVRHRRAYQGFVREVFTGRGRGVCEIVTRTGRVEGDAMRAWLRTHRLPPRTLPKDLTDRQWAALWELASVPRNTYRLTAPGRTK